MGGRDFRGRAWRWRTMTDRGQGPGPIYRRSYFGLGSVFVSNNRVPTHETWIGAMPRYRGGHRRAPSTIRRPPPPPLGTRGGRKNTDTKHKATRTRGARATQLRARVPTGRYKRSVRPSAYTGWWCGARWPTRQLKRGLHTYGRPCTVPYSCIRKYRTVNIFFKESAPAAMPWHCTATGPTLFGMCLVSVSNPVARLDDILEHRTHPC